MLTDTIERKVRQDQMGASRIKRLFLSHTSLARGDALMDSLRQTLLTPSLDAQPRPSDKEIYLKPISHRHMERPVGQEE